MFKVQRFKGSGLGVLKSWTMKIKTGTAGKGIEGVWIDIF
jgi:hypothetical protein